MKRQSRRWGKRQKEIFYSTGTMATIAKDGAVKSQALGTCMQEPKDSDLCFPRHTSRKVDHMWSGQDSNHCPIWNAGAPGGNFTRYTTTLAIISFVLQKEFKYSNCFNHMKHLSWGLIILLFLFCTKCLKFFKKYKKYACFILKLCILL